MNDGGPAFPSLSRLQPLSNRDGDVVAYTINEEAKRIEGMSLRSWLAGQALTGSAFPTSKSFVVRRRDVAKCAVAIADATIAELNKTNS